MYHSLPGIGVNTARYNMFKMGTFSDARLPPNKDCLVKHIQRANYQSAIWKSSLSSNINPPSPFMHGWKIDENGHISIDWMDGNCAPDVLLKNYNCGCKTGCSTNRCYCKKASLFCTELCQCTACINTTDEQETDADGMLYMGSLQMNCRVMMNSENILSNILCTHPADILSTTT